MFYEVIFETGAKSVAEYADDEEAKSALEGHHNRAISGEAGGPYQGPAERIKKVLVYDEHPANYMATNTLPVEEVKKALGTKIDELAVGGEVSTMELAAAIRDLTNPHMAEVTAFDSQYQMPEKGELEGAWA